MMRDDLPLKSGDQVQIRSFESEFDHPSLQITKRQSVELASLRAGILPSPPSEHESFVVPQARVVQGKVVRW